MSQVLGLGGIFFLCADIEVTRAWYQRALGLDVNDYGGFDFLHKNSAKAFPEAARSIFSPFDEKSDYFKPSQAKFMVNLIVDDLDGMIARLKAEKVDLVGDVLDEPYGRFAWIMDPDGRKVELWQPIEPSEDVAGG